jgi:glutaminase
MADLASTIGDIAATMHSAAERGAVASYISELAEVDPAHFGIRWPIELRAMTHCPAPPTG